MVLVEGVVGAVAPASASAPPGIRTPFCCADARQHGLSDASFDLLGGSGLWPINTELCVYAGSQEECTFTAMVAYLPNVKKPDHPAYGMALATAGMIVQVDKRLNLAVPSIPVYEVRSVLAVCSGCWGATVEETGRINLCFWTALLAPSILPASRTPRSSLTHNHVVLQGLNALTQLAVLWNLVEFLFSLRYLLLPGSALPRATQNGE